ncbi:MAG: hypothetical protein HKN52_10025 [Eudoraea sp.]|nr:hypothetical protein [Eudoraea sp.]
MSKIADKSSNKTRQRFLIESVALFLMIATPFIFKLHVYLPTDPEATLSIFGYTIDSNGFNNINTYVWFLFSKIIPLYLLIIWFFTCKHWWYHIILIPLCMYAFQLFEVMYSEDDYIDTDNILWLLPVCMVVIPFVYLVRVKLYDKYVHGIDLDAMDAELKYFRDKERQKQDRINRKVEDTPTDNLEAPEKETSRTFGERFQQVQHSLKNLFNFFL